MHWKLSTYLTINSEAISNRIMQGINRKWRQNNRCNKVNKFADKFRSEYHDEIYSFMFFDNLL